MQTSQTGGQQYSDTSSFSIPWLNTPAYLSSVKVTNKKPHQINTRKMGAEM